MLVLYVPQLILLNSSLENVGFAVRILSSLASLWTMAALVPNLALSVRRPHDTNRSGGWLALGIGVSAAGSIVMFAGFVVAVFDMVSSIDSMTDQEILILPRPGVRRTNSSNASWTRTSSIGTPDGTRYDSRDTPRRSSGACPSRSKAVS